MEHEPRNLDRDPVTEPAPVTEAEAVDPEQEAFARFNFSVERLTEVFPELEPEQIENIRSALNMLEHDATADSAVGALFGELVATYAEAGLEVDEDEIMSRIDSL